MVEDLSPGTYQMKAVMGYKGNDGKTRLYNTFPGEGDTTTTIIPPGATGDIFNNLQLDLWEDQFGLCQDES
ncbi:MAG: hypothetical protein HC837_12085 [Chloroflexaceae bacterium]|nr:hypothetical protein [Chloroflexaceae bacterium]